jgi:hypothetical protein
MVVKEQMRDCEKSATLAGKTEADKESKKSTAQLL